MKINLKNEVLSISLQKTTTIDHILTSFYQPRKQKYLLYQQGCIKVNESVVNASRELTSSDILTIDLHLHSFERISAVHRPIKIAYEDDIFLIVNKEANMIIHGDGRNDTLTLSNLVQAYFDEHQQHCPVRPIHRLDKDTSGLIIFCKVPFFQPMLDAMLAHKQINRRYYALVDGQLDRNCMTITQPIGKDRHDAKRMRVSKTGKEASTTIRVSQQFTNYTLVECELHSGRTHQIRVHLQYIQHPLLSDPLYGKKDARIKRLALHAYRVHLIHPLTNLPFEVTCVLPTDMKKLISASCIQN